jgi:hypothetical protein
MVQRKHRKPLNTPLRLKPELEGLIRSRQELGADVCADKTRCEMMWRRGRAGANSDSRRCKWRTVIPRLPASQGLSATGSGAARAAGASTRFTARLNPRAAPTPGRRPVVEAVPGGQIATQRASRRPPRHPCGNSGQNRWRGRRALPSGRAMRLQQSVRGRERTLQLRRPCWRQHSLHWR